MAPAPDRRLRRDGHASPASVTSRRTASTWLENFYKVHARLGEQERSRRTPSCCRRASAIRTQTYELLDILRTGDVEIHQAKAPFTAGGRQYAAGSWVIRLAQPYGAFAKTMLERQVYPDLRLFPGGPPKPPYDVTGHTLGLLMGVEVDPIEQPFEATARARDARSRPALTAMPPRPKWAYLIGPESNAGVHRRRAAAGGRRRRLPRGRARSTRRSDASRRHVDRAPSSGGARILAEVAQATGLAVAAADKPRPGRRVSPQAGDPCRLVAGRQQHARRLDEVAVRAVRLQPPRRSRRRTSPVTCRPQYDAIVLPTGVSRETPSSRARSRSGTTRSSRGRTASARTAGRSSRDWVTNGGTLVAIGQRGRRPRATLLDLPIEQVLPESRRRPAVAAASGAVRTARRPSGSRDCMRRSRVPPTSAHAPRARRRSRSIFYCPGSLLQNEFDVAHPVGVRHAAPRGRCSSNPIRRTASSPASRSDARSSSRYPANGPILQSGWLLGEDLLRDQANVVAFRVGNGYVVTIGKPGGFPHAAARRPSNCCSTRSSTVRRRA